MLRVRHHDEGGVVSPSSASAEEKLALVDHGHQRNPLLLLKKSFVLGCNICAWYYTNGMNGISMQSFAAARQDDSTTIPSDIAITSAITATQLGLGALLGWCITLCMQQCHYWPKPPKPYGPDSSSSRHVMLSLLHSCGSLFTNLGFTFGSASVVQILKLLEPFETLVFSRVLLPQETNISVGLLSSMILIVGAAISLITIRPTKPHVLSMIFAILSGLTLSLRNVLQRKRHVSETTTGSLSTSSKVQRAVQHFYQLSRDSFVVTSLFALVWNGILIVSSARYRTSLGDVFFFLSSSNWSLLAWHPLYNTFSMIVLGYCSALTHSLLNVGKRVLAIAMAIVWFQEDAGFATVLGLSAVAAGGCWYALEKSKQHKSKQQQQRCAPYKLIISALLCMVVLHTVSTRKYIATTNQVPLVVVQEENGKVSIFSHFDTSSNCTVRFKDPAMSLCYFVPYGKNFGDELGPAASQKMLEYHFGCSAQNVSFLNLALGRDQRENRTCVFSLGSIFHYIKTGDHVWGTGINPKWQKTYPKSLEVHSVRGPNTEALVRKHLHIPNSTVIGNGDPGFLIPYLYQEYKQKPNARLKTETPQDVCFIPHFHDQNHKQVVNPPPNVRIISVQQDWRSVVTQIETCDFVASSSLHGIIVADALGIPSLWFQFSDSKTASTEGDFKYRDYYESISRPVSRPESVFPNILDTGLYQPPIPLAQREAIAQRTAHSFPLNLFESSANRTLVVILGSLRGGELAWQTMYEHVLDMNNADLALCIGEVPAEQRNSSMYTRAKYLWEFPEYDDWADAMDLIDGTKWRDVLLPHVNVSKGLMGGVKGHKGSGAVIFMARWFLSKKIEELGLLQQYDRFVVTRSDHYYKCAHDLRTLDPSFMWVPRLGEYGGITDRHLVCNSRQIQKALNIYPHMMQHPELYLEAGRRSNPESFILKRWRMENLVSQVKWFDRTFFTCAADGDTTRWRPPTKTKVKEGVHLKYGIEYGASICTCSGGQPKQKTKNSVTCNK